MAGHSKWSSIKRKKNINDKKRGKLFSKLTNEIKMLSKNGVNIKNNFKLKNAISRALNKNINKATIDNIIKKEKTNIKTIFHILILPNDCVFIVECVDSNDKNIISILKNILLKFSGQLISYDKIEKMFDKTFNIHIIDEYNEEVIIDYLSSDKVCNFSNNIIFGYAKNMNSIVDKFKLINLGIKCSFKFIAKDYIHLKKESMNKLLDLKNKIREKINTSNIYTNISGL